MGGGRFFRENFPETPKEKIQYAIDRGLSAEEVEAIRHIVSDLQPKGIEAGKQNKHLEGTNEMKQKQESNAAIDFRRQEKFFVAFLKSRGLFLNSTEQADPLWIQMVSFKTRNASICLTP